MITAIDQEQLKRVLEQERQDHRKEIEQLRRQTQVLTTELALIKGRSQPRDDGHIQKLLGEIDRLEKIIRDNERRDKQELQYHRRHLNDTVRKVKLNNPRFNKQACILYGYLWCALEIDLPLDNKIATMLAAIAGMVAKDDKGTNLKLLKEFYACLAKYYPEYQKFADEQEFETVMEP